MPDGTLLRLKSSGMPLGIKKDICYESHQVPFPPEALILLYSDALLDACNENGEQLGEKGFFDFATTAFCQKKSKDIIPEIIKKFYEYAPLPLADDLTAFLIKRAK
jgi:serine phosphatase RsbU (regulator of sigma subunit)